MNQPYFEIEKINRFTQLLNTLNQFMEAPPSCPACLMGALFETIEVFTEIQQKLDNYLMEFAKRHPELGISQLIEDLSLDKELDNSL